jgi:hypothetical protein
MGPPTLLAGLALIGLAALCRTRGRPQARDEGATAEEMPIATPLPVPSTTAPTFRLSDHAGVTIAGAVLVLTGVKILAVSHGDTTTAAALVAAQGWNILPTVLLTLVPFLGLVPMVVVGIILGEAIRERDPLGALPVLLVVFAGIAVLLTDIRISVPLLVIVVIYVLLGLAMRRWWPQSWLPTTPLQSPVPGVRVVALVVLSVFVVASVWPLMWLPAERIDVRGQPIVGYVLAHEGATTTLLTEENRRILRVPTDEVGTRETCSLGEPQRSLLLKLYWPRHPEYRACR